jgi:hypothetical protein
MRLTNFGLISFSGKLIKSFFKKQLNYFFQNKQRQKNEPSVSIAGVGKR